MLGSIGSDELTEWMAYYELEPWGEYRADVRAAIISQVCAAPYRKKGAGAGRLEDYMIDWGGLREESRRETRKSPADLAMLAMAITAAMGGTIEGGASLRTSAT